MRPRISGGWGLSLASSLVQMGVTLLASWTYAERSGLGDEFVDGLKALVRLPFDLLGVTAVPGGGEA